MPGGNGRRREAGREGRFSGEKKKKRKKKSVGRPKKKGQIKEEKRKVCAVVSIARSFDVPKAGMRMRSYCLDEFLGADGCCVAKNKQTHKSSEMRIIMAKKGRREC